MKNELTAPSRLLDYQHDSIQSLIKGREWKYLPEYERIGAIYDFVRNEIAFGYNESDDQAASEVLRDGFGQCNTKATLFMALLRGTGIACRIHGFTIDKSLQRGVVPELAYAIAPRNIVHSWVEIQHKGKWINLEGFILDDGVLGALQAKFEGQSVLCGYGAGTNCLQAPSVQWNGEDTYIQETGINQDFGVYDTPDKFFAIHSQDFGPIRKFLYQYIIRHWMNYRVAKMRKGIVPAIPGGANKPPKRTFELLEESN